MKINVQSGDGRIFMGVVYKFKKEVIDFVLQQKRTDYGLGCRQLAALTSEKFKIQASKSSINAIIKNANLSNSIGRRPSTEPVPKKFQIPSQKKQQLLSEVRLQQPQREPVVEPPKRGFSSFAGSEAFLRHVETLKAQRVRDKGPLRDGMGCVFLKAAQWQLSRTSLLGGLLRKYIQEQLPLHFDAFCDVLPCLNVLGIDPSGQAGQLANHGLWDLNGFASPPEDSEVSRWLNAIKTVLPSLKFFLEYEKAARQVFMEVKRLEFYLEDGSAITTDARLSGFWKEKVPLEFSTSVEQAMTMLAHCVVSNNRPAIFLSSGRQRFPQEIFDFIAALEGTEGKHIKKVDVFDVSGEWIAVFSAFPRKKRFFMLGVWPGQEEFSSSILSKSVRVVEPFYDEEMDRIMYVAAGPAPIFQKELKSKGAPLRSITIMVSPEEAPIMVILTNCADMAPTDILRAFLGRWPNLDKGPAGRAVHAAESRQEISPDVAMAGGRDPLAVFQDWGNALDQYCQKHFWGMEFAGDTSLTSKCYSLPGYYIPQEQALLVSLRPPVAYPYSDELQSAVERVNEAGITDPLGRKIIINIVK